MADYSIYIAIVAKALEDDATLNGLVDGQIVPGFRRSQADQYLSGTNQACIGIRALDTISTGLGGCEFHGLSEHEILIEFHLIQIAADDTYLAGIADQIQQIMKKRITKTMDGISYSVSTYGQIRFHAVNDDQFLDRVQLTGTCKLKFLNL